MASDVRTRSGDGEIMLGRSERRPQVLPLGRTPGGVEPYAHDVEAERGVRRHRAVAIAKPRGRQGAQLALLAGSDGRVACARAASARSVALPFYTAMGEAEVERVVGALAEALARPPV